MTRWTARLLLFLARLIALALLPFVILLKGCVFLYLAYGVATWLALAGSALLTAVVLAGYACGIFSFVLRRGIARNARRLAASAALLVVVYSGFTLHFFPETNVKKSERSSEFSHLHPFLRLSLGSFLVLDPDLIVSDMHRTPEEYTGMRMQANRRSLHYVQSNGYVHAVDLRTIGRGTIRNMAVEQYFRFIGFNTLRHRGTADHLHISLSIADSPGVI